MDKKVEKLEFESNDNNNQYKVEKICNSMVYTMELEVDYVLGLNHLVFGENYS